MDTEIQISGAGEGNQVTTARDIDRTMRVAGHRYPGSGNSLRTCAYVPIGATEIRSRGCNEGAQGKELGISEEGFPRTEQEVLGLTHMGEGIFCEHGWHRQGSDQEICQRAAGGADP